MLNDDHSPLKVELVDAPCVSEFLHSHHTCIFIVTGREEREFLRKMRLRVMGWEALVGMTLVLGALTSRIDMCFTVEISTV